MTFEVQAVAHHGITVASLEGALTFFEGVLGFRSGPVLFLPEGFAAGITGVPGASIRAVFVEAPGLHIELLEYQSPDDRSNLPPRPCDIGSAHLALFVDNIEGVADAAKVAGWHLAGTIQQIVTGPRVGGYAAYLTDGHGTIIELVQRPVSEN